MTRRTSPRAAAASRYQRGAAALVLAAATLGLSGCQWTSPVTTELQYDAADGTSTQVGDVHVLGALIISSAENGPGTLVGALDNRGKSTATVPITVAGVSVAKVEVPAGERLKLSDSASGKLTSIPKVPAPPGAMTEVMFGDARAELPVLGPNAPYEKYAPRGSDSSTETGAATGTATPSPTTSVTTSANPNNAPATMSPSS